MYDDVPVEASRRIGVEGQGMAIALSALDAGRLGIAAAATGLAQAALDRAVDYAKDRQQFGRQQRACEQRSESRRQALPHTALRLIRWVR